MCYNIYNTTPAAVTYTAMAYKTALFSRVNNFLLFRHRQFVLSIYEYYLINIVVFD